MRGGGHLLQAVGLVTQPVENAAERRARIWQLHTNGVSIPDIGAAIGCERATVNSALQIERRRRGIVVLERKRKAAAS